MRIAHRPPVAAGKTTEQGGYQIYSHARSWNADFELRHTP
jgi:hypothetical protein